MLTLFDLSAAFDSVDHDTLLKRLLKSHGLGRQVQNCRTGLLHIRVTVFNTYAHRRPVLHCQKFCTEYHRDHPRADHIPSVHRWPAAVSEVPPADPSRLCGRHSDLRVSQTRRFCRPLRESVRLCRWGFGLDGIQSAAAELRQDWGPLVFVFSSTTLDPVWSGPHWHHWRAASFFDRRPQGLHWHWYDHEDPRHSCCQSVLRGSTTDPERVLISLTSCVHWLSARWTTATQFSLVSLVSCKIGCIPSWMPPPLWFCQRGGRNA